MLMLSRVEIELKWNDPLFSFEWKYPLH